MEVPPNPIDILEKYFDAELKPDTLGEFDGVDPEQWIDFSKHYLAVMKNGFAGAYLDAQAAPAHAARLYFEPSFAHDWAKVLEKRFAETPLLGYCSRTRFLSKTTSTTALIWSPTQSVATVGVLIPTWCLWLR